MIIKKEELVVNGKVGGNHGWSHHKVVEFRILREGSKAKSRAASMDFRRADFNLFRYVLGISPKDIALERRRTHDSWLIFKGPT